MALVSLAMEVTDDFVCGFMKTGIEFPEAIDFAERSAKGLGVALLTSEPQDHLGGFFDRLPLFGFPTIKKTWCNRDLKVRPQQKMLNREFGKGDFYKLVGVRKFESSRRKKMHSGNRYIVDDYNASGHLVYPLLLWNRYDVVNYLKRKGLPTSSLYKTYGVSGCYWCPFYQPSIYKKVIADNPCIYDKFIECEKEHGPSVGNYIYLGDIKREVLG
jgi:3'-phosphoadenosine 5'-phosphosulfate sulfotransferase (PAPS reductase)/FAD synthetase